MCYVEGFGPACRDAAMHEEGYLVGRVPGPRAKRYWGVPGRIVMIAALILVAGFGLCSQFDLDLVVHQFRLFLISSRAEVFHGKILDEIGSAHEREDAIPGGAPGIPKRLIPDALTGSYGIFDGFNDSRLDLSPSGFYYEFIHCEGVGEVAFGAIHASGDLEVVLQVQGQVLEPGGITGLGGDGRFVVVAWGGVQFVVPREAMPEFCEAGFQQKNAVYYTFLHTPHFLGGWCWDHPELEGMPTVPDEFRRYFSD